MPGDDHGHDNGLAGACRHLERNAVQQGIGSGVGCAKVFANPGVAAVGKFGEVDGGFEGFDLAEEEAALAVGTLPVFEQGAGGVGDAVVIAETPLGDGIADIVDELVFLLAVAGRFGFEDELFLAGSLARRRNGNEITGKPAGFDDFVGDAVVAEVEVTSWLVKRRVDDRILDHDVGHAMDYFVISDQAWSGIINKD